MLISLTSRIWAALRQAMGRNGIPGTKTGFSQGAAQGLANAAKGFAIALSMLVVLLLAHPAPALAYNYSRAIMDGQNFPNDDFSGSNFSMAKLRRSDLSGTNFENANLFGARLDDANLTGANLRSATLDSALMKRANLTNADLTGAYAMNTVFDKVVIKGADFTDVLLEGQVLKGLCELAEGTNPSTGKATRDTLMCDDMGF